MPTPNVIRPPVGSLARPPAHDLRTGAMSPEGRRLARTGGAALAVASLVAAFAASAQTAVYGPDTGGGGGFLAWVFALFVAAAVLGVFLLVLTLVRGPTQPDHPPGTSRNRT